MQSGIIVLIVLGVMIFTQVMMLAATQKRRHEEILKRLARLEQR